MTSRTIGRLAARYAAERSAASILAPCDPEMPAREPDAIDRRLRAGLRWTEVMHARGFRLWEVLL